VLAVLVVSVVSDSKDPVVSILVPANNGHVVVGEVVVSGTAKDTAPGVIAEVKYRLNGGGYVSAAMSSVNGKTNWVTPMLGLVPGTNFVYAYSVDGGGNESALKTNKFYYDTTDMLRVKITGVGEVKTNATVTVTNDQEIARLVGRPFALTALVGKGTNYVFTNWTAGTSVGSLTPVTTSLVYSFQMESNLIVQANFITNPFTAVAGTYAGLFWDTNNGINHASAGFFSVKVTEKAAYSCKLVFDGDTLSGGGKMNLSGQASRVIKRDRKGKTDVTLSLDLDWASGNQQMIGTLSGGNWTATLEGDKATFNTTNPAAGYVGAYTFMVPRTNYPVATPGGVGYGLVTNNLLGILTLKGGLGDGAKLVQKVSVSKEGLWPMYAQLYKSTNMNLPIPNKADYRGAVMGWIQFTNQKPVGEVHWIKTGGANNYLYPAGFTNVIALNGSPYVPPAAGERALAITNGLAIFSEGNLSGPVAWGVSWSANNAITAGGAIKPVFTLAPKTGYLKGSFPHPQMGNAPVNFFGAILQNQNDISGYFTGTNQSGMMRLE
jgi:hypothetical protein